MFDHTHGGCVSPVDLNPFTCIYCKHIRIKRGDCSVETTQDTIDEMHFSFLCIRQETTHIINGKVSAIFAKLFENLPNSAA